MASMNLCEIVGKIGQAAYWTIARFQAGAATRLKGKAGLLLICFTGCLQFLPGSVVPCHGMSAVIPVDYFSPADISSAAAALLSPQGRLSFDRRTHSLIVVDTPRAVARIRELVRRLDRPAVDLKIHVRSGNDKKRRTNELTASGRVSGPGWSAGTEYQFLSAGGWTSALSPATSMRLSERLLTAAAGTRTRCFLSGL